MEITTFSSCKLCGKPFFKCTGLSYYIPSITLVKYYWTLICKQCLAWKKYDTYKHHEIHEDRFSFSQTGVTPIDYVWPEIQSYSLKHTTISVDETDLWKHIKQCKTEDIQRFQNLIWKHLQQPRNIVTRSYPPL